MEWAPFYGPETGRYLQVLFRDGVEPQFFLTTVMKHFSQRQRRIMNEASGKD